jgi:hypothetical protein
VTRTNVIIRSLGEELQRVKKLVALERGERACNVVYFRVVQRTEVQQK